MNGSVELIVEAEHFAAPDPDAFGQHAKPVNIACTVRTSWLPAVDHVLCVAGPRKETFPKRALRFSKSFVKKSHQHAKPVNIACTATVSWLPAVDDVLCVAGPRKETFPKRALRFSKSWMDAQFLADLVNVLGRVVFFDDFGPMREVLGTLNADGELSVAHLVG
jgi:hypothetical protein